MKVADELKRCPFCGGEWVLETMQVRKGWEADAHCLGCLASIHTITYDTEQEAINAAIADANRRADGWIAVTELPHEINDGDVYCIANKAGAISAVRGKDMQMIKRSGCVTWFKNNGPLPAAPKKGE